MEPALPLPFIEPQIGTLAIRLLTTPDAIVLAFLIASSALFTRLVERENARVLSASVLMNFYRREWMLRMAERDPRMVDSQIITEMRRGTAFFASTAVLLIGAGMATLGNIEPLEAFAEKFEVARGTNVAWEVKIMAALVLLGNASVKFIWSHRLYGYVAVFIGAVHKPGHPKARPRSDQAAEICNSAATYFRRGLQSLYFSAAAMVWLLGPGALAIAVAVTLYVLWRREYASTARAALVDRPAEGERT